MTLLEVIKKAEEKQKILGENTTKVYILIFPVIILFNSHKFQQLNCMLFF